MPSTPELCDSGIEGLGLLPWGSHCCNFYHGAADLAECLVPFFRTGLAGNEACFWITSEPLNAHEARRRLGALDPQLASRESSGQLLIQDFSEWYYDAQGQITARALRDGIARLSAAQRRGFSGVRMSGNSFWLERRYWSTFTEYEKELHTTLRSSRIVVLCSYSLERCSARDVPEIVNHHDFALVHESGRWRRIDSRLLGQATRANFEDRRDG